MVKLLEALLRVFGLVPTEDTSPGPGDGTSEEQQVVTDCVLADVFRTMALPIRVVMQPLVTVEAKFRHPLQPLELLLLDFESITVCPSDLVTRHG